MTLYIIDTKYVGNDLSKKKKKDKKMRNKSKILLCFPNFVALVQY